MHKNILLLKYLSFCYVKFAKILDICSALNVQLHHTGTAVYNQCHYFMFLSWDIIMFDKGNIVRLISKASYTFIGSLFINMTLE